MSNPLLRKKKLEELVDPNVPEVYDSDLEFERMQMGGKHPLDTQELEPPDESWRELFKDGESTKAFKEHLKNSPDPGKYQLSGVDKVIAGLVGGIDSFTTKSVKSGIDTARGLMENPYNRALEEHGRKGKNLETASKLENLEQDNKKDAFRLERDINKDKEAAALRREDFQNERAWREYQKERDKQTDLEQTRSFDEQKRHNQSLEGATWMNARTRQEGQQNKVKKTNNKDAQKKAQTRVALNEALQAANEIEEFLYDEKDVNLRSPEKAVDKHGAMGWLDNVLGTRDILQQTGFDNKKGTQLKALAEKLRSEYLYEKSGKTITENEIQRLENYLFNPKSADPVEQARRLRDFKRVLTELIEENSDDVVEQPQGEVDMGALGNLVDNGLAELERGRNK